MINYNISLIVYSYILEFENLERRICAHIFIDVQKKSMGKDYTVGSQVESWQGNMAQSLTFIVTADCNLRCKYCYITHKSNDKRMSFEVAQKFIDYILESPIKKQKAVILDFIGGEPLLEVELIDSICDSYTLQRRLNGKINWSNEIVNDGFGDPYWKMDGAGTNQVAVNMDVPRDVKQFVM